MKYNLKVINIFLIISMILLSGFKIFLLNKFSTVGEKKSILDDKISEIESNNNSLTEFIASSSAMSAIAVKAQLIGLTKDLNLRSLVTPLKVANNNSTL